MFRLPIVKFFNRIFNRVTITAVLVALQVLWLLWAFWSFTAGRVWLNGALKALSILIVLYLVRKDENSAYKIGWIVLIGLLPLLGRALSGFWQQGPRQASAGADAEGGTGPSD